MIQFSPRAREHVSALSSHYQSKQRPDSVRNLHRALAHVAERLTAGKGPFFDAPRPYPSLRRPPDRWLKEGRYWVAFQELGEDWVITGVYFETADIPGRSA